MSEDPELKTLGEKYLVDILASQDPELLRGTLLETIVILGTVHRRLQIHMLLHPLFFLAGFLTCYFLSS